MKEIRDILRLPAFLALSLLLGACAAAVPGGAPVGTPSGGAVATPSEFFGATGEKASTGDEYEKTNDGSAASNGPSNGPGDAVGLPTSDNATPMPLGTAEGMIAYNPLPGGFPAPTQDFPVHMMSIDGKASVCRASSKSLLVTIEGFVKKPVGWQNLGEDSAFYAYEDCGSGYAVSIYNKDDKKTVETNLQTVTEAYEYEGIERTGFLRISVPIAADSYPSAAYQLQFTLVPASSHSQFVTKSAIISPVAGDILPWALLQNLPQDPAKIALCPPPPALTKDVMTLTE